MSGRRVRERWPEGVGASYVSVPVALLEQAGELGLNDGDIRFLLALESFDWGNGRPVAPSQKTLAELCDCSVRAVQRRADKLVRLQLLERQRTHGWGVYAYGRRGLGEALQRLAGDPDQATPASPGDLTPASPGHLTPASPHQATPASPDHLTPASPDTEATDSEANTQTHTQRAREVLAVFNEVANGDFTASSFIEKIARCIKHKPELSLEEHRKLIERAFRDPWWKDDTASPSVVYGSIEAFERVLHGGRSNGPRHRSGRSTSSARDFSRFDRNIA